MTAAGLDSRIKEWVAHDLLTAQQADSILAFEQARAKTSSVPVFGEVLGYVGGALSLAALLAIVTQFWRDFGAGGQIGLAALVAAACLAGGWAFAAGASPQAKRLGYFLLFLGTAAFGFLAGLVAYWLRPTSALPPLVGSLGALVAAVAVWSRHRTALQVVAIAAAFACLVPAVAEQARMAADVVFFGFSFFLLGLAATILGEFDWLTPRNASWAVGCVGMLVGVQTLAAETYRAGGLYLILGVLVSVVLIAVALWRGRGVPLGFGAAGIVIFVPQAVYRFFEGTIGVPIVLLLAGVLLVAMSAVVIRVRPRLRAKS